MQSVLVSTSSWTHAKWAILICPLLLPRCQVTLISQLHAWLQDKIWMEAKKWGYVELIKKDRACMEL